MTYGSGHRGQNCPHLSVLFDVDIAVDVVNNAAGHHQQHQLIRVGLTLAGVNELLVFIAFLSIEYSSKNIILKVESNPIA